MNRDRKNYLAHSLEGGLFMGGLAFLSGDVLLPLMAQELNAPAWLISLMPNAMMFGLLIVPIISASFIERSSNMKRICLLVGMPQRITFLLAGLAMILVGDSLPVVALAAMALAPFLSGIIGGIGHGAWMQLVARTVPAHRRSSLSASRNLIAAAIGILAGIYVDPILEFFPGVYGFGVLHLITFAFMVGSFLFFTQIDEKVEIPVTLQRTRSLKSYLIDLVDILRVDRNFRYLSLMRIFGPSANFVTPYVAIYAVDVLDEPKSLIGGMVIAVTLGQVLGNLLAGYFGDKSGGKTLLIWARVLFIVSFLIAAFTQSMYGFLLYFFISSATKYVNMIGNMTLMLEIAPDDRRPTYGALAGLLNGPTMLIFALIGARFWSSFGSMQLQALIATAGMLVSLAFILPVTDPRKNAPA